MGAYWESVPMNGQRLSQGLLEKVIVDLQDDRLIPAQTPLLNSPGSIWISLDHRTGTSTRGTSCRSVHI